MTLSLRPDSGHVSAVRVIAGRGPAGLRRISLRWGTRVACVASHPNADLDRAAGVALNKLRGAVRGAKCRQLARSLVAGGDGGVAVVAGRG